jgi:hypothetical protein
MEDRATEYLGEDDMRLIREATFEQKASLTWNINTILKGADPVDEPNRVKYEIRLMREMNRKDFLFRLLTMPKREVGAYGIGFLGMSLLITSGRFEFEAAFVPGLPEEVRAVSMVLGVVGALLVATGGFAMYKLNPWRLLEQINVVQAQEKRKRKQHKEH